MQTTERIRPVAWAGDAARSLPVVLLSLFIVVVGVDALIATQPGLVLSLRDDWEQWVAVGISAPWATLLAATATVACAAIAAALVGVVLRGITDAPYLWLASALVCACSTAISRMSLEIPVRMPLPMFAWASAVLLLGGGAFFQGRSRLLNLTGVFLTSLPLALLGVGFARGRTSSGAAYPVDEAAQLLLATLAIASVGTLLIAVAARRLQALGGAAAMGMPTPKQVAKLLERAQSGEQRAARAEYQLQCAMRNGGGAPRVDDAREVARMRGPRVGPIVVWALLAVAVGACAVAYFGRYLPLQQRLATQERLNHELTQQHAAVLVTLRGERERVAVQQTAASAPVEAAVVGAVPTAGVPVGSKPVEAAKAAVSSDAQPKPAAASRASKRARAPELAPKAEPAPVPRGPVSRSDDPLEGLDGF